MRSVPLGYDQQEEDRLLDSVDWTHDGYRLFDISVLAGSSAGGGLPRCPRATPFPDEEALGRAWRI